MLYDYIKQDHRFYPQESTSACLIVTDAIYPSVYIYLGINEQIPCWITYFCRLGRIIFVVWSKCVCYLIKIWSFKGIKYTLNKDFGKTT